MWQERIIHSYIHVDIWIVMKKPYLLKMFKCSSGTVCGKIARAVFRRV